jgi:anhydro-N-acetylmuramic acid kinase
VTIIKAIGAISGTSMDGIDVALIQTDGISHVQPNHGKLYPYAPKLRAELQAIIEDLERAEHDDLTQLEQDVSDAHANAVLEFCQDFHLNKSEIALVGLHGQTVFHRPERNFTRQLGIGQRMADRIGINVVNRFRHADIASGGHGAPLVPLYHQALTHEFEKPLMVLNLGGVANVTYIDGENLKPASLLAKGERPPTPMRGTHDFDVSQIMGLKIIAFDTGPASALLDDFVKRRTGRPCDENGALAASGTINQKMVDDFMSNPFFNAPPPKSLDRQDFNARAKVVENLSDSDGAATLAAFTIQSVAASVRHVPKPPLKWLVAGGGRLNTTFMQGLRSQLGVPVESVDTIGWDGDFLEAQCFAYLAVRSSLGLPLSLPSTTGVPKPMTGGELWKFK